MLALIVACDSDTTKQQPDAAHGGRDGSVADAESMPECIERDQQQYFGVASASFGDSRLHFKPDLTLTDPGLDEILNAKLNGLLDMVWLKDHFVVATFGGFWDIAPGRAATYVDTAGFMHGIAGGDIDGDGDGDLLLGANQTEMVELAGTTAPAFATRFHVWERTRTGFVRRSEILSLIPGGVVGMPFAFMDIDGDHHLDILSYWDNQLIGYFGDGAFEFRREVLEQGDPELVSWGPLMLRVEDRNGDGADDVLIVMGRGGPDVLFRNVVFPRDASGGFQHHGPPAEFDQSPSPIDAADVTGDGLSDVVAQGFVDEVPTLRLTASVDWSMFAPSRSLEPASLGVELGDIDADGVRDVLTSVDGQLIAMMGGSDEFQLRELGISTTNTNLLDFAVRPGDKKHPARLYALYSTTCDPACDPDCLDRCFTTGCTVCEFDTDCPNGGLCAAGSCTTREPRTL